jgi:hypothetical protein
VDVVELLLDLGMSAEIEESEEGQDHPLHLAAYHDSLRVAELLIERGAEVDPREASYSATPLWGAVWRQRQRMIDFLSPLSGDVWRDRRPPTLRACEDSMTSPPCCDRRKGDAILTRMRDPGAPS